MKDAPEPTFDALYRDLILEHYRAPHGKAPLAREDVVTEGMPGVLSAAKRSRPCPTLIPRRRGASV